MSAAPHPSDIGYAGLKMSADEFLALGETHERYELIDGLVVMSPSPSVRHKETLAEIIHQLKTYAGRTKAIRVLPETDVRFRADKVYRPDISVYAADALPPEVDRLTLPPALIVEVLSPGTKPLDLLTKRDDYDDAGVQEYWVADPATGDVRCWQRQTGPAGHSRLCELPPEGDTVTSSAFPGLVLDLRPLRKIAGVS